MYRGDFYLVSFGVDQVIKMGSQASGEFTVYRSGTVGSLQFTGQVGTRLGMIHKIVINQGDFILNDSKIMINQGGFWVNLHFCNRYCCCCYRCYFGFDSFSYLYTVYLTFFYCCYATITNL